MTIAERYAQLRAAVPAHVTILAVSKFHPVEAVREAVAAGVTDIGENYVQEAQRKFGHGELAEPRKHFIGHVQTNKAKAIASTFDVVQSVDRADAASALAKAAASLGKRLPVLLQLNISPSERFGCPPADATALAQLIRSHESLDLQGVMAIGPITGDESEILGAFQQAAQTFERIGGTTLSLGMSGDWRLAVQAGSTMIRVGSTIFGPRPARPASKNTAIHHSC
ncbi:MAG TPA: YggS family pyridoxal phosphate-dependent enzyme [Candidatus Baltobacteraceae bacterium]|nr:YggS family pyridoxal phosphate-dependent enzyme [Candidatus Baltobacteraceae bacterium]